MTGKPLRVGLVGTGQWGMNILRTLNQMDGVALHRIATRRGSAVPAPQGCIISADWNELIAAGDLDGLVLALPTPVQTKVAQRALEAKLPLFVEKPLALDEAVAAGLRNLAVANGVPLIVDHIYLYHPAYHALRARVRQAGAIGAIESRRGGMGPFRAHIPPLWDWGPHDVSMCLDLVGEMPNTVEAQVESRTVISGTGEIVRLDMTFPSGAKARCVFGNAMPEKARRLAVTAAEGVILFDDLAQEKLTLRQANGTIAIDYSGEPPLTEALRTFRDAVVTRRWDRRQLDHAVDVVRVLARAEASLRTKH